MRGVSSHLFCDTQKFQTPGSLWDPNLHWSAVAGKGVDPTWSNWSNTKKTPLKTIMTGWKMHQFLHRKYIWTHSWWMFQPEIRELSGKCQSRRLPAGATLRGVLAEPGHFQTSFLVEKPSSKGLLFGGWVWVVRIAPIYKPWNGHLEGERAYLKDLLTMVH